MKNKRSAGEHLSFITVKYDVHPDTFFCALLTAGETGKAKCGDLVIECRGKIDGDIYFLIKKDDQVVAQLPVTEEFLKEQGNPLRNCMNNELVNRFSPAKKIEGDASIKDLRTGMGNINLQVEVLSVSEPKYVQSKFGNHLKLAKAVVSDSSGEIKLCLWDDQINQVSKGNFFDLENVRVFSFKGEKQLSLGKKGNIKRIKNLDA